MPGNRIGIKVNDLVKALGNALFGVFPNFTGGQNAVIANITTGISVGFPFFVIIDLDFISGDGNIADVGDFVGSGHRVPFSNTNGIFGAIGVEPICLLLHYKVGGVNGFPHSNDVIAAL